MRFKPKEWAPPRSRAARIEEAEAIFGPVTSTDILKDLWVDGWERPAWAKLALKFGWITSPEYYALDLSEPRPGFREVLYQENPMFKMLAKRAS